MNNTEFISGKKASEILGVHQRTLHLWDKNKKIETIRAPGGKRFYNVAKYLNEKGLICKKINNTSKKEIQCIKLEDLDKIEEKIKITYARVSSLSQKDDLERQKELLKELYPTHNLIEDIGSGINLTKRGILKILELAINGKIEEVVILHKDRLARFGYDLIEHIINKYSNGKIIIVNKKLEIEPEEEMVKDVLQIMNVFVAKMNGRRKYKKNNI
jgi:predicted site-specific integrase-resolvase